MNEIVPPKLNKDTGIFSLIINRTNTIILIGVSFSLFVWSSHIFKTLNQRILIELVIGLILMPFLFDVYGRPLHVFLYDSIKYFSSNKEGRVLLGMDFQDDILRTERNKYCKVFRIEPINLSMSGDDEIIEFKQQIQSALFSLKNPVQILTTQKYSTKDKGVEIEKRQIENLPGILQQRYALYLEEYMDINRTMERYFYLVFSTTSKSFSEAVKKLGEEYNSFGKSLEQSKVKLIPLTVQETTDLFHQIMTHTHA